MDNTKNFASGRPSPKKGGKKFVFQPPPEAPVFRPTIEEFKDPLVYIRKIRPIGEKTGICKIIPPVGWKTPFALDMNTLKFVPRIQRINELEARTRIKLNFNDKLTKFFALSGKTFQVPVMEKTTVDLYTLHRKVKELGGVDVVNKEKKWADLSLDMGFTGKGSPNSLKSHYDNLILPFLQSQSKPIESDCKDDDKENYSKDENDIAIDSETGEGINHNAFHSGKVQAAMRELKSLRFLGPGPKMAVCDGGSLQKGLRTRGKKIMYEFDPLAKYMCKGCKKGDLEETFLVMCVHCEDRYHHLCLIPPLSPEAPPVNWRCPKCVAADGYKPLEEFGFAQAEREYTLNEFKTMANEFKRNYFNMDPDEVEYSTVEQEFWRVVSSMDAAVTVEYGADLHVIEHGSGFPRLDQRCVDGVDRKKFEKYADSPWNLNNLPVLKDSILRYISADISGMKIPWMYAGMCFATFCWHNEDHWSYSINYLHLGEAKTWYGVSGSYAEQFEAAMQKAAPELFESQPDLLHQLVTIMDPNDIMAAGVPVYRTDQKRGEFVITFPRAYHAGFNQGFNFAEACNFAPADWLVIGRECIYHYSQLRRTCVFSHDELVCKMATMCDSLERDMGLVLVKDMTLMVEAERLRRTRALRQGVGNALHVEFDKLPDDERQCCVCNTTVFLSAVACSCDYGRLVCLDHISKLCNCDPVNYVMKYQLKLDILQNLLVVISSKLCGFDNWTSRVQAALNCKDQKKLSLRNLTELLVEAKEKEFPHSELVELLEYHVRRCIECSALSKALVANCTKKDNPSKITVEDLELFHQEIEKLPCSISEESAVKDILDKARKFQKSAQKCLSMKDTSPARLLPCFKIGQSLNLDLPEMQEIEKKLMEFEWIEQVRFVIESGETGDLITKLIERGKSFPDSPGVIKTRNMLNDYLASNNNSRITESTYERLRSDTTLTDLERLLTQVLKGEIVLYLQDLENLILKTKREMPESAYLKDLEQGVSVARNWEMAAKALFLKKGETLSLIEVLWPRSFVSRFIYFSKYVDGNDPSFDFLLNPEDEDHFKKKSFRDAMKQEYNSLCELRLENVRMMDAEGPSGLKCLCGNFVGKSLIVCELCKTPMHLKCFNVIDSSGQQKVSPGDWDSEFRAKRLCGYCKRTTRPSLESVTKLVKTVNHLKIKIPECFALQYTYATVEKWRKSLKAIIDPNLLMSRSNEIIAFFHKMHAKKCSEADHLDHLFTKNRLFHEITSVVSRTVVLALKEELIQGNRFEITPPELNHIWNVLNPLWIHAEIESNLFHAITAGDMKSVLLCSNPLPPRKPTKRKSLPSTSSGPSSDVNGVKLAKKKKKKLVRPAFPVLAPEEHEPETNCAAAVCLKPEDHALDWVMCDGACKQWFHMKCVDLDNKQVNDEFEYVCTKCVCNRVCDQVTGDICTALDQS